MLSWEREISRQEQAHEHTCNQTRQQYDLEPVTGVEDCQSEPCHTSCPWRGTRLATSKEMEMAGGMSE